MKMEHRLSVRKPISIDVSLYYAPVGLITGKTRNMSLAGMFVELADRNIPKSAALEVAFMLRRGNETQLQRVRALVARVTDDGIGVMFDHFKYSTYCELQEMLKAA